MKRIPDVYSNAKTRDERLRELEKERARFLAREYPDRTFANPFSPSFDNDDYLYQEQSPSRKSDSVLQSQDLCIGTDTGLKGRIKVGKGGHAFVDLEPSTAVPPPGSLAKSLAEYTKAEKERIKAEKVKTTTDTFSKLVAKEQKRSKYHISEKALLEEEKAKYAQLEDAYHKLLIQVQQLQQSHLQDLRNTETRFHSSSSTLQKALVLKSEETSALSNQIIQLQTRHDEDAKRWMEEKTELTKKLDQLEKGFDDTNRIIEDKDKKLSELNRLRKELSERVATREAELIKYGKILREKEGDYLKEKEVRMRFEVQLLKAEETVAQREAEMKAMQDSWARKQNESEELVKNRTIIADAKREVEDLTRREANYLAELDQAAQRERKLFTEVEELSAQQRRYVSEISRLTARQGALSQDIEMHKSSESKLKEELEAASTKIATQTDLIDEMERQIKNLTAENSRYQKDTNEGSVNLRDAKLKIQSLESQVNQLSTSNESLLRERDAIRSQRERLEMEKNATLRECDELHNQLNNLSVRLETEIRTKTDLKQQNKDKLMAVSQKINDLQNTLSETQSQLSSLRENEATLRQTLRQKEELISNQQQNISELQSMVNDLQAQSSKDTQELESLKIKKRDEILAIQDKFNTAKNAMEQEVTGLRVQLQQKLAQIASLSEEVSRIKVELSESSADRFSLEARVSELLAGEASYQRQVANLQMNLNQKQQDLNRLVAKHQVLVEQLKRMEDEVNASRGVQNRDTEISKLQSNMTEISNRLKSQVDLLLDDKKEERPAPYKPRYKEKRIGGVEDFMSDSMDANLK